MNKRRTYIDNEEKLLIDYNKLYNDFLHDYLNSFYRYNLLNYSMFNNNYVY